MRKKGNISDDSLRQFEALVEKSRDWLFRFAYMRIGSREDAEDLVQEVLLSLFRCLREGREIKDQQRYLVHSISNACIDYWRRRRLPALPIDQIADVPASDDDRQLHEEFLRVGRLLDGLPPEQAETLRLKCYDGLTFRQIAELQGVPEPTAKSRYRYAIMNLQNKLKDER